jgi:hypothetical protein
MSVAPLELLGVSDVCPANRSDPDFFAVLSGKALAVNLRNGEVNRLWGEVRR